MIHHFSIVPAQGVELALGRILERAHDDPWILHLNPAPVHFLIFCVSLDHVQDVRRRYKDAQGSVDTEVAVLEIDPQGIHVDQDCEPASRKRMEEFVRWIFENFAPCKVLDHDSERDLSLLASRNPGVLFEPE